MMLGCSLQKKSPVSLLPVCFMGSAYFHEILEISEIFLLLRKSERFGDIQPEEEEAPGRDLTAAFQYL